MNWYWWCWEFDEILTAFLCMIIWYKLLLTHDHVPMTLRCVSLLVNTLGQRQNGRHFADDISKCIFLNENVWILIKISLKFVPMGPINNIPALVLIMACRRPGDKPLSEPMIVSLSMHICVARPQWVKSSPVPPLINHQWHWMQYKITTLIWCGNDLDINGTSHFPEISGLMLPMSHVVTVHYSSCCCCDESDDSN